MYTFDIYEKLGHYNYKRDVHLLPMTIIYRHVCIFNITVSAIIISRLENDRRSYGYSTEKSIYDRKKTEEEKEKRTNGRTRQRCTIPYRCT